MPQQELDLDSVKDWLRGSHCPPAYRQTMKLLIAEVERLRAAAASSPPPTEQETTDVLQQNRSGRSRADVDCVSRDSREVCVTATSPGAREAQQWQPIETAPQSEDPVLVFDGDEVNFATRGFTNPPRRAGWFDEKGWLIHPTHWMPLPVPPNTEARAAAPGAPIGRVAPTPAPRFDEVFFAGTAELDAAAGESISERPPTPEKKG